MKSDGQARGKSRGTVALVISPTADYNAVESQLRAVGITIGERVTVGDVDVRRPLGAFWRRRGYAAVVAAGGDGTIGAAVSQIAESDVPLGILPLGTSNDVARSLGVPLDLAAASAVIANGVPSTVDVGVVRRTTSSGYEGNVQEALRNVARRLLPPGSLRSSLVGPEARFLHAATLGLNVEFARLATDVARRRRWGPLNYASATVEALTKLHPVPVTLRLSGVPPLSDIPRPKGDEHGITYQAVQVAVVNTPVFGGAFNLRLPGAQPSDQLLDVVVIEALESHLLRETVEQLLAALGSLAGGQSAPTSTTSAEALEASELAQSARAGAGDSLLVTEEAARFALPGVHHYQARSVRIETPSTVAMTLDGEISARTPVEVRLARRQLRVLVPTGMSTSAQ
ncbi:MAG TPA: diacylglycerol kinase family protein [Ktedonobacterales bacterium]|jgi:diacylglycerol kinase family enzyme